MDAKLKGAPSFIWRSLWSSLGILKEGLVWRVGNGSGIKIWKDKWLPRPVTYQIQTPINMLDSETRVEPLIDKDCRSWTVDLVQSVFREEEAKLICSIPISRRGASDRRIWVGSDRGTYTIKSAYFIETKLSNRSFGEPSTTGSKNSEWRDLWRLEVPGKVKILIWKCLNNILPTKDRLYKKNIVDNYLCPVCEREKETIMHALWVCPAAADIWGGETSTFRKWRRDYPDFQQLWGEMIKKLSQENIELAAACSTTYHIWTRRNAYTFQNQPKNPASIVSLAQTDLASLKEIKQSNNTNAVRSQERGPSQLWKPPEWPFFKVNFDVAFDKDKESMGMGIILRDSEGGLQATFTAPKTHILLAFQAKVSALHRAMELCSELGLNQVIIEGDAKVVIDSVNSKNEDNSWLGQEIDDL
ncbi:uncharacterized protein LOC122291036 [Carya illinoinensis]|uniref:uncharacterized protein LOC122291036 n=1 Tax=Carya illinoinensis TaxID=32201 RepID=UPI001C722AF9|nr:uncharacterized protein LOC122291036 [Carya illinoinensis]